jgi:hypothetical protein
VVLKLLGRSHGVGMMRLDSLPSLLSMLGFALAQGHHPQLSTYDDQELHWRLVVVVIEWWLTTAILTARPISAAAPAANPSTTSPCPPHR